MSRLDTFEKEVEALINRLSLEGQAGDTPDFIVAKYLRECLETFGNTIVARETWYGRSRDVTPRIQTYE